ncbi:MAG: sigma factor-like helix-turn-helix DNA-binding protein [Bacteroidota bacterium]
MWKRKEDLQVITLQYYLLSMVRYKVIRYFRHNMVKRKYAEHYKLFEAIYENVAEPGRDHSVINSLIQREILKLPERCQVAITLRLTENLSNGDIAKRMNITKKTVEMYMFKAFSHLRSSYQNIYIE